MAKAASKNGGAADLSNIEPIRDQTLLIEYKMLQKYCPLGIYVLPSFEKTSGKHILMLIHEIVLHGVYFVR